MINTLTSSYTLSIPFPVLESVSKVGASFDSSSTHFLLATSSAKSHLLSNIISGEALFFDSSYFASLIASMYNGSLTHILLIYEKISKKDIFFSLKSTNTLNSTTKVINILQTKTFYL